MVNSQPKDRRKLINKLVKVFNLYIRYRDSWLTTESFDKCVCISCGRTLPFSKMDAGHFLPSTYSAVRFHEFNVNSQCSMCNRFKHGNLFEYGKGMLKKYGQKILDELDYLKHDLWKPTAEELIADVEYWTTRLNSLKELVKKI